MTNTSDQQSIMALLERTYHADRAAMDRFLDRPHRLLGGVSPRQSIESGPGGMEEVRNLLLRANGGVAV
ncbi:antitoxin Xre/MbcA/ParS toxin-binding domain-containing protein [Roseovarius sp. S4756]|uniref:antitoxin Xre/MbcA/ParS toxin-binding domain-containing protein n=1 Tax=Roseovarius maritimus TaxID=3342637 RepID=UPI00372C48FD